MLRGRVIVIVCAAFALLTGGLLLAGLYREDLATHRHAEAIIAGQEPLLRELVEGRIRLLEQAMPLFNTAETAAATQDRAALRTRLQPLFDREAPALGLVRIQVSGRDGGVLFSSEGALFPTPLFDENVLAKAAAGNTTARGILQDSSRALFVGLATPLAAEGRTFGMLTIATGLAEALSAFKRGTGADAFLVDHRDGGLLAGTAPSLWNPAFNAQQGAITMVPVTDRVFMTTSMPVRDMSGRTVA
ncbi:MAG: hypothetical protein K2X44_10930, partial [Magnetospirillum sp.]|nr:hypothetical protein [Magnetospirillum sp.]